MIRVIPFLIYLWLVAMHQVFLDEITSIYSVSINLPVLLVLVTALYKSELVSCWFGFVVGLVAYSASIQIVGWQALIMALIGFLTYHAKEKLNLDSLQARLLLVGSGILVHNIVTLILSRSDQFFFLLWSQALTGAIYTTVVAWIFFILKEEKITVQKFRSIF